MNSILVNGTAADTLDANDRGLQYGDGLFETIAYKNGQPCFWTEHLQRMRQGCERLGLKMPANSLWESDLEALNPPERCVIKLTLTRGVSSRGYACEPDNPPTRICRVLSWPDYPASNRQGIRARICTTPVSINSTLAGIKHLNRLDNVLARNEWQSNDYAEGFMLDHHQHVIEGTMSNVFCVLDDQLYTPDLQRSGVNGIMRQRILQLAEKNAIEVNQLDIGLQNFLNMDGIFVTNSLIGLWPVTTIVQQDEHYTFSVHELVQQLQHQLFE